MLRKTSGLVHGGNIYDDSGAKRDILDFSANINPLGMPPAVRQALVSRPQDAENYPDPLCRSLRRALANHHGLSADWIICGNGAADLIYRLAYAVRPARALLPAPTFAEYEHALDAAGCAETVFFPLQERFNFTPGPEISEAVSPGMNLVFFCNPNNPTGAAIKKQQVLMLADRCRAAGAILVVDECFADFMEQEQAYSVCDALGAYENVAVLRAFTKMYAMAGVRLGYLLTANQDLLQRMAAAGPPWSVSTVASRCGIAALSCGAHVARTKQLVARNRALLTGELTRRGCKVYPSLANYLLFRCEKPGLADRLEKQGVLVRSCSNYRNLDAFFYRIAVRSASENRLFLERLDRIL